MRPLRLSMTAFGPYAGTEVVDFDALADLGLFAVAGKNGAGKTTIFDGLYFALYGSLPGRRSTYGRLRSDHAAPTDECRVELDFVAHGQRWRIERLPKQQTAKRRGSGSTERQQRATLYQLDGDQAVAVLNRIAEVNARCRELIGLSGPQFERVALLPQGEFSRLLRESGSERRELLRALFSSEIFGDASALLTADASTAAASGEAATTHLDQRQERARGQLRELLDCPPPEGAPAMLAALDDYRAQVLAPSGARAIELRADRDETAEQLRRAIDVAERITTRDDLRRAQRDHQARQDQVDADIARLALGRAAIPVIDISQVAERQGAALRDIAARRDHYADRLASAFAAADLGFAAPGTVPQASELRLVLDTEHGSLTATVGLLRRVDQLSARIAELDHDLGRLAESEQAAANDRAQASHRRQAVEHEVLELPDDETLARLDTELDAVRQRRDARQALAALDRAHDELRLQLQTCRTGLATFDEQLRDVEDAQRRQPDHNERARDTAETLATLSRRQESFDRAQVVHAQLIDLRKRHRAAQDRADALFDGFVRGAAGRLALELVDGESCAVCGSLEHPAPAPPAETDVSQQELNAARSTADELAEQRRTLEAELEQIHHHDATLSSTSADELRQAIDDATAQALHAENAANDNVRLAAGDQQLRSERADLAAQAERVTADTVALSDERNQLIGALGDHARSDVTALEERYASLERSRHDAHRAAHQRDALHRELRDLDQRIAAIDLASIELQKNHSATSAERTARQADLDAARHEFPADHLDRDSTERRAEAIERARADLDRLASALANYASTADAVRRAELTVQEKLGPSPFGSVESARHAHLSTELITMLDASTSAHAAEGDQLIGQLRTLADLPETAPDVHALRERHTIAGDLADQAQQDLIARTTTADRLTAELETIENERSARGADELAARRLERVAALVKGDNDQNTSLENWVLGAHLREVVELANVRLRRSTQERFQLCVLDDGEHRRGRWGLDLAVEDTVTGTRRPTAGLSGGELFQASLALALGLADVVMNQTAGVRIDALFIDEGFGSLDETSVERVIDLLDDVRSRGAMVGVITHVTALLDALPRGITVVARPDGTGSTIEQPARAA